MTNVGTTRGGAPRVVAPLVVKLLVLALAAVGAAAASVWVLAGDDLTPGSGVLLGSVPPAGQTYPDLARVVSTTPAFPARDDVAGHPVLLVATCLECESGDRFGGFLSRLDADRLPHGSRLLVLGWSGDPATWRKEWQLGDDVDIHVASSQEAVDGVLATVGMDTRTSGLALLYDSDGAWRSTFHVGQLDLDDVTNDMRVLAADG